MTFLGLPRSGNRSKSDWELPGGLDAFLVICMKLHQFAIDFRGFADAVAHTGRMEMRFTQLSEESSPVLSNLIV